MKKTWNRFIAVVAALILAFTISGCSVSSSSPAPDNSTPVKEQTEIKKDTDTKAEASEDKKAEETKEPEQTTDTSNKPVINEKPAVDLSSIPAFTDKPYCEINGNVPQFGSDEITSSSYEYYSNLDSLGRCGVTMACIGKDLMPTGERGKIGMIKPTGWHTVKYDCVDGKYLYNRSHLIGWQLSGENANEKNLITGTRYFNVEGMLPFENMVADYVKETNNHVMYRVTPIFEGNNLVAKGVQMEAYSVEDKGDGISYNVFVYNNQPGVIIDYATGDSRLADGSTGTESSQNTQKTETAVAPPVVTQPSAGSQGSSSQKYILNTNTKKFHNPSCSSVKTIKDGNKQEFNGAREDLISQGYEPCKKCNP